MTQDIDWLLESPVAVVPQYNTLVGLQKVLVIELPDRPLEPSTRVETRMCVMEWQEGRLLFNGEDIETEQLMAYIGLFDAVEGRNVVLLGRENG